MELKITLAKKELYEIALILSLSEPVTNMFVYYLVSISSTFYPSLFGQYFCIKKLQSHNVTREKLLRIIFLNKKFESKMLMKLTTVKGF